MRRKLLVSGEPLEFRKKRFDLPASFLFASLAIDHIVGAAPLILEGHLRPDAPLGLLA